MSATGRLGWAACPLPLVDVYVAVKLLSGDPIVEHIISGEVRPVVASSSSVQGSRVRFVEAATVATHVLVLGDSRAVAALYRFESNVATPGIARPSWSDVTVSDKLATAAALEPSVVEDVKVIIIDSIHSFAPLHRSERPIHTGENVGNAPGVFCLLELESVEAGGDQGGHGRNGN